LLPSGIVLNGRTKRGGALRRQAVRKRTRPLANRFLNLAIFSRQKPLARVQSKNIEQPERHRDFSHENLYTICMENVRVDFLCDNLEFAEIVSTWIFDEWIKPRRNDLPKEQLIERIKISYKDRFPIRLIAMQDNRCVGTIALVENDLANKCRDYLPWLSALYVDEKYRGQGIAEKLITRVKEIAKQLGYKELYLRTETASEYYRNRRWQYVETVNDNFNLRPDIFKVKISASE